MITAGLGCVFFNVFCVSVCVYVLFFFSWLHFYIRCWRHGNSVSYFSKTFQSEKPLIMASRLRIRCHFCFNNLYQVFTSVWLDCSPIARETWIQSLVESYKRLKKWYLMPSCLILSIMRYGSRLEWSNPGKGVASSPTSWCSSYQKGSLRVTVDYRRYSLLLFASKGQRQLL